MRQPSNHRNEVLLGPVSACLLCMVLLSLDCKRKTLHIAGNAHIHMWFFRSVIGLPGEEDWPRDVALPRQAFHSKPAQPIEKFVTDIDELGKDLLLVSSCST